MSETSTSRQNTGTGGVPEKLSNLMLINIVVLSVVGFTSIILMLFGEFDGKISRLVSTLLLFGIFTALTALDTKKLDLTRRYMFISQIGNIYMLALGLIFIWGTLSKNSFDEFTLLPGTLFIAFLIRVGVFLVQKSSDFVVTDKQSLSFAAFLSAAALSILTLLLTLPIATDPFLSFGEGYWKLTVGVVLFGGLAICITALLVYYFREQVEKEIVAFKSIQGQPSAKPAVPVHPVDAVMDTSRVPETNPFQNQNVPPASVHSPEVVPAEHNRVPSHNEGAPRFAPAPPVRPANLSREEAQNHPAGAPQFAPPSSVALPWPVFPNGYPLPAKANGRPNFEALKAMAEMYYEGEKTFFG